MFFHFKLTDNCMSNDLIYISASLLLVDLKDVITFLKVNTSNPTPKHNGMDWNSAWWNVQHDIFPDVYLHQNWTLPQAIVTFKVPSVPRCTIFHFPIMPIVNVLPDGINLIIHVCHPICNTWPIVDAMFSFLNNEG